MTQPTQARSGAEVSVHGSTIESGASAAQEGVQRVKPYYEQDGITIYHADCRDVLPTLQPSSVDLVLTDPPYGINLDTNYLSNKRGHCKTDYAPVYGDDEPFDPGMLLNFGNCVLWGANHYADKLPASGSWIVWDSLDGLWSDVRDQGFNDARDAELAWTNLGGTVRMYRHRWNGHHRKTERQLYVHPTQKPVALMSWILNKWTNPGDLVLDPYMGSGPVAKACQLLSRRYIGIEIEERYCEIAAKRLQQAVLPLGGVA